MIPEAKELKGKWCEVKLDPMNIKCWEVDHYRKSFVSLYEYLNKYLLFYRI